MKTNSLDLCFDRKALYTLSDELRKKLIEAEEEYYACCQTEAGAKTKATSKKRRDLRDHLEEVEISIKLMEKLEDSLGYLESEGVL